MGGIDALHYKFTPSATSQACLPAPARLDGRPENPPSPKTDSRKLHAKPQPETSLSSLVDKAEVAAKGIKLAGDLTAGIMAARFASKIIQAGAIPAGETGIVVTSGAAAPVLGGISVMAGVDEVKEGLKEDSLRKDLLGGAKAIGGSIIVGGSIVALLGGGSEAVAIGGAIAGGAVVIDGSITLGEKAYHHFEHYTTVDRSS